MRIMSIITIKIIINFIKINAIIIIIDQKNKKNTIIFKKYQHSPVIYTQKKNIKSSTAIKLITIICISMY